MELKTATLQRKSTNISEQLVDTLQIYCSVNIPVTDR